MPKCKGSEANGKPLRFVSTITDNDVLFGRGTGKYDHKGNIQFRAMVKQRLAEYVQADGVHGQKTKIAFAIVKQVLERKGRFLRIAEPSEVRQYLGAKDSKTANAEGCQATNRFSTGRGSPATSSDNHSDNHSDKSSRDDSSSAVGSKSSVDANNRTDSIPGDVQSAAIAVDATTSEQDGNAPKIYIVITSRAALILKAKQTFRHAINSARLDQEYAAMAAVKTAAGNTLPGVHQPYQHTPSTTRQPVPMKLQLQKHQPQQMANVAAPVLMPAVRLTSTANETTPIPSNGDRPASLPTPPNVFLPQQQAPSTGAATSTAESDSELRSTLSSIQTLLIAISIQLTRQRLSSDGVQRIDSKHLNKLIQILYSSMSRLRSIVMARRDTQASSTGPEAREVTDSEHLLACNPNMLSRMFARSTNQVQPQTQVAAPQSVLQRQRLAAYQKSATTKLSTPLEGARYVTAGSARAQIRRLEDKDTSVALNGPSAGAVAAGTVSGSVPNARAAMLPILLLGDPSQISCDSSKTPDLNGVARSLAEAEGETNTLSATSASVDVGTAHQLSYNALARPSERALAAAAAATGHGHTPDVVSASKIPEYTGASIDLLWNAVNALPSQVLHSSPGSVANDENALLAHMRLSDRSALPGHQQQQQQQQSRLLGDLLGQLLGKN